LAKAAVKDSGSEDNGTVGSGKGNDGDEGARVSLRGGEPNTGMGGG